MSTKLTTTGGDPQHGPHTPDFHTVIAGMGEPLASYATALLAYSDADRRTHAAQVARDANAECDATLDRERHLAEVRRIKENHATATLMGLRWAAELYPACVQEALDPTFRRELDNTQTALVELEQIIHAGTFAAGRPEVVA
ncbi:hypothetical protein [Gemmata sp.]|uniref:hypothetical protein n=1 Tax=Gemmata sp. TaxID=1914242 RepID=UPI003F706A33